MKLKHIRRNSQWAVVASSSVMLFCVAHSGKAQQFVQDTAVDASPDLIAFKVLFRRAATYKEMADDAEAARQDKPYLRQILPDRLKVKSVDADRLGRISIGVVAD